MESSETIQAFLEHLEIKKAVLGGFDREAVYESMQKMAALCQRELDRAAAGLAEQTAAAGALRERLDQEFKDREEYDQRVKLLAQSVQRLNEDRARTLEEARREAERIIAETRDQIAEAEERKRAVEAEVQGVRDGLEREKLAIQAQLFDARGLLEKSLSDLDAARFSLVEDRTGSEEGEALAAQASERGTEP